VPVQPPVARGPGCRADGDDLGVRGGITVGLAPVVATGHHGTVGVQDHCPDRDIRGFREAGPTGRRRPAGGDGGFRERFAHRRLEGSFVTRGHPARLTPSPRATDDRRGLRTLVRRGLRDPAQGQAKRPLQGLNEPQLAGYDAERLVRKQVEVACHHAQIHLIQAEVGED